MFELVEVLAVRELIVLQKILHVLDQGRIEVGLAQLGDRRFRFLTATPCGDVRFDVVDARETPLERRQLRRRSPGR